MSVYGVVKDEQKIYIKTDNEHAGEKPKSAAVNVAQHRVTEYLSPKFSLKFSVFGDCG